MDPLITERLVDRHYEPLYRFAMGLAGSEFAAADLTQETFYLWASKGHQLRDPSKAKTWLFTTLYREFLRSRREGLRESSQDPTSFDTLLSPSEPDLVAALDASTAWAALLRVAESYRTVLVLFYLEAFTYLEIAETLELPIGTVMSRISRGKEQLRRLLADPARTAPTEEPHLNPGKIVSFRKNTQG